MQMHVYIHGNIIKPITVQSNQSIGKYRLISFLFLARILDFFRTARLVSDRELLHVARYIWNSTSNRSRPSCRS